MINPIENAFSLYAMIKLKKILELYNFYSKQLKIFPQYLSYLHNIF